MKFLRYPYLIFFLTCFLQQGFSQQSLGINTPNPDPSAALDVSATNKGMLIPRISFANRPANPATGLLIYQTDNTPGFYYYDGSGWKFISTGNSGGSGTVTTVSANAPLSVTNGSTTPQISLSQANATTNGFLSSADWSIFNSKQNTLPQANATTNGFLSSADWSIFNNKFSLPSLTAGSLLFSDGTGIAQNNSNLFWDNTAGKMSIGKNTIAGTFSVNSANPGYDSPEWIAGNFGGQLGNRVVMGILNGSATIGAHTNPLDGWADLVINPGGFIRLPFYTGIGNQMLVVAPDGLMLATPAATVRSITVEAPLQVANATTLPYIAMPAGTGSANGYLKSADWIIFNNKQNALSNASASVSGILTSADWTTFNNKQNALSQANGTTNGFLSSADWTTFNNKQNTLSQANGTTNGFLSSTDWTIFNSKQNALVNANATNSGILTNTDWTIFNNKFTLPSLTSGSILFSNGTTIAQKNSNFSWDNFINQLRVSSDNDGTTSGGNGGFNKWISASFGGVGGNRVVIGTQNGEATIGGHNNSLGAWAGLTLNPAGDVKIPNIAGSSTQMVTVSSNGTLASQAIPTGGDNLGNHTATQNINVNTNWISNNGTNAGIKMENSGKIIITNGSPTADPTFSTGTATTVVIDPENNITQTTFELTGNTQPRQLVVNGSIRQSYYTVPVSVPGVSNPTGNEIIITWNHNLGYGPIVMMSTDGNGVGAGSNMERVTYTTYNNNANQTIFKLYNASNAAANGNFRWIIVH
jgi:hypothetical protein